MVRVRNEQDTLRQSLESLIHHLTIPYQMVIILHLCTDDSENIVQQLKKQHEQVDLQIVDYPYEISKCGFENLCTDADSVHSVVYYYNWCLQKTRCAWKFKWDADFIASPDLISFLNSNRWHETQNIRYNIMCKNNTSSHKECYLSNCLDSYRKYIFWEIPFFRGSSTLIELDENIHILHCSELKNCKSYWTSPPWFMKNDDEMITEKEKSDREKTKTRFLRLIQEMGREPVGMARAWNPECDAVQVKILQASERLDYIHLYK